MERGRENLGGKKEREEKKNRNWHMYENDERKCQEKEERYHEGRKVRRVR